MAQYEGFVRWFNAAKGYGFVGSDSGPDVFCHYSAIQLDGYKSLKEGEAVSYDVIQGEKGPQADKVTRIKDRTPDLSPGRRSDELVTDAAAKPQTPH